MKTVLTSLTLCVAIIPSIALAEAPASTETRASPTTQASVGQDETGIPNPRTLTHDAHEGFMLRMSGGAAGLGAGFEVDGAPEFGVGGGGAAINLLIGASVFRNFAVHADLLAVGASETRVGVDDADNYDGDAIGMAAAGAGVTYYVMPYDVAIGGSFLYAKLGFEDDDDVRYETDYAFLTKFDVTKEWAVSKSWGLGVGVSAYMGAGEGTASNDNDFETGVAGASLNMTATYF